MRDQKQLNARYREAVSHWNIAGHPRIQSTLLMVLYLDHMCQCGLHVVLQSHTGTLMHHLAAEPCCSTLQYSRTFIPLSVSLLNDLLTPYSMVWDWRVSRAGPMLFYWPKLLFPYYSLLLFPFLIFLSIGWYCGAGVFGLIGCIPLSLSLALHSQVVHLQS